MSRLKDKIGFGIDVRRKLNGADLYVTIFQIASVLPALYVSIGSGYLGLFTKKGVLSVLFDLGIFSIPRVESLAASTLYRSLDNEIIAIMAVLIIAFILGLLKNKIFKEDKERGIKARKAFIVLIALDLLVRLIPMSFNLTFGWVACVVGFLVRALCAVLLALDIKAEKNI